MTTVWNKLLSKLGVKEFSELNEEEKQTYRQWEEIMNGRTLTDEEIEGFFELELEDTLVKLESTKIDTREDIFLKVKLQFLRKVMRFLRIPEMEKKALQANIEQLTK